MRKPSELMSSSYCGPSRVIPLGHLPNTVGFEFIGIDKDGGKHSCVVCAGDDGTYRMTSDTVKYGDLCGWLAGEPVVNGADSTKPNIRPCNAA